MKIKITIALALLFLNAGLYHYTHTKEYVSSVYDDVMVRECNSDPLCLIGAAIVKPATVLCMQDKFLSTSMNTIQKCLQKAVDEFVKENNKE